MVTAPVDDALVNDLIAAETQSTEAKRQAARKTAWTNFKTRAFTTTGPPVSSNVDRVVYCTKAPHEAPPHGVPTSYDWQYGPTGLGAMPGANKAMWFWGQVYLAAGATLPVNTRVALRNCASYTFNGSTWTQVQKQGTQPIEGGAYPESFVGSGATPILRTEADGSLSVKPQAGYNFHFWINQWPRPLIPTGSTGFLSMVEARLVPDDPSKPADVNVKMVVNCGIDWYADATASVGVSGVEPGAGQGRFCVVASQWQPFAFSTLTETQIRANPPPV